MDQQELHCEVRKEVDRRHGRYMEQYAAVNEDLNVNYPGMSTLKAFRLDINQELGQVSTKLSNCGDSFTPMQQANNDLFQELKELLSDIKAILKEQQQHGRIDVSIPRFGRGDPADWIYQAEACFRYCNIPPADYVLLASIHLDRPASRWFQGLLREGQCRDWDAFKLALTQRFGPSKYENPAGKLTKLMQTTSVSAYQECFEDLSCQITGLSPGLLRSIFISGLKPEIKEEVMARNPENLYEACSLARLFEEDFV